MFSPGNPSELDPLLLPVGVIVLGGQAHSYGVGKRVSIATVHRYSEYGDSISRIFPFKYVLKCGLKPVTLFCSVAGCLSVSAPLPHPG